MEVGKTHAAGSQLVEDGGPDGTTIAANVPVTKIVDQQGERIGTHEGHQHFTVGQRKGIGVAASIPLFVLQKDPRTNEVVVGPRESLASVGLQATDRNWLVESHDDWRSCDVRIRYNALPVPGSVRLVGTDQLEVRFDSPQMAVAPGQAVVCYEGDLVLGGAWIDTPVSGSGV